MLKRVALYWHTVRHLKAKQVTNRIVRRLRPSFIPQGPAPVPRAITGVPDPPVGRPRSILTRTEFRHLGLDRCVKGADWWGPGPSRLWMYHLHYFDGLVNTATPPDLKRMVVADWIAANPPFRSPGWEPYPISLRVVNWVKWLQGRPDREQDVLQSMADQLRWLERSLEYHLLGNHLFANAKALIAGGLFFAGPESDRWRMRGERILDRELPEQFLPDGGHFELSPVYHAVLTEDLLDLISLYGGYGVDPHPGITSVCERALNWLRVMTRPDGLPPLFNDASYEVAPTYAQLAEKAGRLGLHTGDAVAHGTRLLRDSGYLRHDGDEYTFFADLGDIGPSYIPGHAHCDMLSFELFARGRPLIVDTGTSTYEEGARRDIERGTAAHNTVQIGRHEQSEMWGSFRVARRAKLIRRGLRHNAVEATARVVPSLGALHTRRFQFEPERIVIEDEVGGVGSEALLARVHLHPGIEVSVDGSEARVDGAVLSFKGAQRVDVSDYEYAPSFNCLSPARVLVVRFDRALRTEIRL